MSRRTILVAVGGLGTVLALVTVLLVVLVTGGKSAPRPAAGAATVSDLLGGIPQQGAALGSPKAPVTLVEYADVQCPYCGEWARNALPDVVRNYVRTGKVRLVFRGLAFVGPDSETALRTVVAAGRQNRLWNVLELLYENQGEENTGWVTHDLLSSVTASVPGLSATRVLADADSGGVTQALQASTSEADAMGIDSTPTFLAAHGAGPLQRLDIRSLDYAGIAPTLNALLAS
jgi:protein-disulfide isomerase